MAGENGQVSFGLESREGVPWHDSFYTPFVSETFRMERPNEPNPNIDGKGTESRGDNLQATGTGSLIVSANSEYLLPLRAHQRGYYEVELVDTGVYLWTFREIDTVEDTPIAHWLESVWFALWRDQRYDPSLYRAMGAKCSQLQITQDAFSHVRFQHDFLFLRDTYSRAVQQAVNAAFTGEVFPLGHRILGDENGDYFKFKITDDGAAGDFAESLGVWGKGAAAYGATEYPLALLMDVMNADDTRYAPREEPYQIAWVDPAGSVVTVNDEFRFYPTSPKPVATLSTRPLFSSSKAEFSISVNGQAITQRPFEQFTITIVTPREAIGGIGSKYFQTIDKPNDGRRYCEISFQSTYLDRVMEQALISGATADITATFYGGYIGSTGLEDFARFTFEDAWFTEAGIEGVTQAGRLPETITLRASSCVEEWQNTIASIAPTA